MQVSSSRAAAQTGFTPSRPPPVIEGFGEHEARGGHVFQVLAAHLPLRLDEIDGSVRVDFDVIKPPVMRVGERAKTGVAGEVGKRGARVKLLSLHGLSLGDDAHETGLPLPVRARWRVAAARSGWRLANRCCRCSRRTARSTVLDIALAENQA